MKEWGTKRLGNVVSRLTNGYVGPTRNIYVGEGVPYLLARHVRDNQLVFDDRTFVSVGFNQRNRKSILRSGDVLLVQSGHIGHAAVVTKEHEGNNCHAMIVISPIEGIVTGSFLSMYFNSPAVRRKFDEIRSGSTVPHLTCGAVKEMQIPLPPLAEQRRIVGVLDEAFAGLAIAKANAEMNLHNVRALFESHLQSVFERRGEGWVEMPLSDLCDVKHGFAFDGTDFSKEVSNSCPIVVTPGNFTEESTLSFTRKNTKRFSGTAPAGLEFEVGDLVVVMTDLSSKMKLLGKPALVESEGILHNQRIGRVVFRSNQFDKRLVYYFMRTERYLQKIRDSATGTMVKHTAPKRILANIISLPPRFDEQQVIVSRLDALSAETQRLAAIYSRKVAALDELKKSLLHEAFCGRL